MSRIEDILDLIVDQYVDLKKAVIDANLPQALPFVIDEHLQTLSKLLYDATHPVCWCCEREISTDNRFNSMMPASCWFPHTVCRECYDKVPRRRLPKPAGLTRTENFHRRYKDRLEDLGILYVIQDANGGITHNYDLRTTAESVAKSMQKSRA